MYNTVNFRKLTVLYNTVNFWFHTISISRIFHNFTSTGPIYKISTFLKMASKFVGSSSSAGGRGMKIEAVTANQNILSMFFNYSQECLYLDHRVAVLENPGQGPSISRRFPKSEALAEDFGNLLLKYISHKNSQKLKGILPFYHILLRKIKKFVFFLSIQKVAISQKCI